MRDWDAEYEVRRDVELDRRLDAGLPTRSATTPPKAMRSVERARVHEQEKGGNIVLTSTITMRDKRNLLRDSQAVHRTLMHACDGVRPLWGTPDMLHLIVRHEHPVDWVTELPGTQQCVTVPTEVPITGVPVRWAMIGNPTISEYATSTTRGKRVAAPPEKWTSWCDRRLGDALNLTSIDSTLLPAARGKKKTMRTHHQRVLFTGEATVKNQESLSQVMRDGTGAGKAYGCGLLLVEVLS